MDPDFGSYEMVRQSLNGKKNALFEPFFYIKTIFLPRQARDKHKKAQKSTFSLELGMFDDIVWDGVAQAAGAKVAIMYSDSADAWMSPEVTSQGSAKRTLYTMLKHMGLPTVKKRRFCAVFI